MLSKYVSRIQTWMIVGGVLLIAVVVLNLYFPSTGHNFAGDELNYYVFRAATLDFPQFITEYIHPQKLFQSWYRPMYGLFFWIQFNFFRLEPAGYHFVTIILHIVNSLILLAFVSRYCLNWRLGFLAGFLYATFPTYSGAVAGFGTQDPLVTFFYISSLWAWWRFLATSKPINYYLTVGLFLFALLSKEVGAVLPIVLFLFERLVMRINASWKVVFQRYSVFGLLMIPYILLEYNIQKEGAIVTDFGLSAGPHFIRNLGEYLSIMSFPWKADLTLATIWLGLISLVLFIVIWREKSWGLLFLVYMAILNVLPVAGFLFVGVLGRYMYLSLMPVAVLIAIAVERGRDFFSRQEIFAWIAAAAIVFSLYSSSLEVAKEIESHGNFARTRRLPLRDISQEHPSFPENTYLYFIDPPASSVSEIANMFYLRYGPSVTVGPKKESPSARWRDYPLTLVYYFDNTSAPVEIKVDKEINTHSSLQFPIHFQVPIQLDEYEITNSGINRGQTVGLLLYWRATGEIDKDYTVFVQLIDKKGNVVAGFDGAPRDGKDRTSAWSGGQSIIDARIITIPFDIPPSQDYRLAIGLYYLPTLERVAILDANPNPIDDSLVIGPLDIAK